MNKSVLVFSLFAVIALLVSGCSTEIESDDALNSPKQVASSVTESDAIDETLLRTNQEINLDSEIPVGGCVANCPNGGCSIGSCPEGRYPVCRCDNLGDPGCGCLAGN